MKNVTLDRTTVLQLDADGTDGALTPPVSAGVRKRLAASKLRQEKP